jgi:hypothetical protein
MAPGEVHEERRVAATQLDFQRLGGGKDLRQV